MASVQVVLSPPLLSVYHTVDIAYIHYNIMYSLFKITLPEMMA